MEINLIHFEAHGDDRGQLIALEEGEEIPFCVRRVYYIFDTIEGVRRGFHAHKDLQQILVCVSGACKVLLDDGSERAVVDLDNPSKGLYVSHNMWREMFDFSSNAVLLVLASLPYDEADYIRNYDDFLNYVNGGEK